MVKDSQIFQWRCPVTVYAGLDLHATNTYVAMIDQENKVLYKQRHRNDLTAILAALDPFKKGLQGVVVESTFNWYWLVDGLMAESYPVHLANPSAIKQYEGLKQIDDRRSSLWLANLLRLGILPSGYIYPKEERPPETSFGKGSSSFVTEPPTS
jgi:transposase